jgi:hypothetical protein
MDIKYKTCDILTWQNIYLSTYLSPTLKHLSHLFTSALKPTERKSFHCQLSHCHTSVSTSSSSAKHLPPSCESLHATYTSHHTQDTFLYEYPFLLFRSTILKHRRHFDYWNQPLTCAYMSATSTVLLPSDTYRKPITSINSCLLPFVTYLLTLPCTITLTKWIFIHSSNMAT